ncbi:ASCH domain-containing protein [Acinetobacter ihumii]|uniref:ASCH domain-containing protein n=1 Tax=Acinetobacter ihumii TaxID=2483802 RepID=UPI001D1916B2|nr:ASCH domain-containing protein [Acinetobacter ihumii]
MKKFKALSIVAPACDHILNGKKTLEIRSWRPEQLPLKDLIIVQNTRYLLEEGDEQQGEAVAIVNIEAIHAWKPEEVELACANAWEAGYWAWEISQVRPILPRQVVVAKRKIYDISIALDE